MDIHYKDEMVLPSSNLYNRNPIYRMAFFILRWAQGWGLISQFSPFRYFPIFFPNDQNSGYTCMISSSYLAGVTAAELRRHQANMNMVEII